MHIYTKDPQSGAGNCTCGAAELHRRHPHEFVAMRAVDDNCVCGLVFETVPHQFQADMNGFLKGFVRGFEDAQFYGYGYDDQRIHPGYEEGVVLGLKEAENMDFVKAYDIGVMLVNARIKMRSST